MESDEASGCALCGREAKLTRHHLIPRTRHANKRNKATFARDDVRRRIAWLCRPCHKQVHALFSEKELERRYDTVAKLAADPEIARFVAWVRDKPGDLRVPARTRRR